MKKKLLAILLAACAAIACAFGLAACDLSGNHTHTYQDGWRNDETGHWHETDCYEHSTETIDYAAHVDVNNDGYCDACEYYPMTVTVGGIYYLCENDVIEDQLYVEFKNGKWTDDEGQTGSYNVSANIVKLYMDFGGDKTEFASGTVNGDDITLNIMGADIIYRKGVDIGSKLKEKVLVYSLSEDKTYYIVKGIGGLTGDIEIPDEWKKKPVKEIAENAFAKRVELNGIVIGSNVVTIGAGAFNECKNLASVKIKGVVEELSEDVFGGCKALKDLYLPSSLKSINKKSFTGCEALENVYYSGSASDWCAIRFGYNPLSLWAGVATDKNINLIIDGEVVTDITVSAESISEGAFSGYKNLKSVTLTEDVRNIAKNAFFRCDNLETLTMTGSSVNSIGDSAFYFCEKLSKLSLPDTVRTIGKGAFAYTGITEATIGDGVIEIGEEAFASCEKLASVTLGSSVIEIGDMAFYACDFSSITIPASVIYMGSEVFLGTPLTSVVFENTSNWIVNNLPPVKLESAELAKPETAAKYLTTSILQNGYMSNSWERSFLIYTLNSDMQSYSVKNNGNVTGSSIIIPSEYEGKPVTKIEAYAFDNCSSLTSINS